MGNICVFCGKKLGLLDRYFFEVFKTKQTACKECLERLSALSGPELEAEKERLLASPDLEDADVARRNSALRRPCSACGGMMECAQTGLTLGRDGGGGLMAMAMPSYDVDVYACPQCGRVELFTAGFLTKRNVPDKPEDVTCPVCGTKHSPLINCPNCALNRRPAQSEPPRGGGKKPPWEK